MRYVLAITLLTAASCGSAQTVQPGRWDVTSTVVELAVPGVPGFLQRMIRGRSRAERKFVSAAQGVDVLLAPDPKARCTVVSQRISNGRYDQALTCPQKRGEPMHVTRSGSYNATGFIGRATVSGMTPKGAMRIVLDQRAARVAG